MQVETQGQDMKDVLRQANQILEDCNAYMTGRMQEEQIDTLLGIQQVERIFDYQTEFFIVHHEAYARLKGYEDTMFLQSSQGEYYQQHLQCMQDCRKPLTHAIEKGIADGSIRKELKPQEEAAVLEGAFGSMLRSECEKFTQTDQKAGQAVNRLLHECVQMSMDYLRSE